MADALQERDVARALGGACLGAMPGALAMGPLCQTVAAPLLGGSGASSSMEWWLADETVQAGVSEGIRWRRSADVLFGVIEVDERAQPDAAVPTALQAASEAAYGRIFRLLDAQGLPHLWRAWNYLPDIHGDDAGLERYRRFNMGRGDAFERAARSVVGRVPAACAIGLAHGGLSVAFMAGVSPAVPVENPRQVSAFLYPADYGPRSPTFSRAVLVHPQGQEWLFVSGTASIVGHRSVHLGDVVAQCHEAIDNLEAVLSEANRASRHGAVYRLPGLGYRVYVRHAVDVEAVQRVMNERCGEAPAVFLLADICRRELLVEIEAVAGPTL